MVSLFRHTHKHIYFLMVHYIGYMALAFSDAQGTGTHLLFLCLTYQRKVGLILMHRVYLTWMCWFCMVN